MVLSLFDEIFTIRPDTEVLIITRRNADLIRSLAKEYPNIQVRQIPNGIRSLPFFLAILTKQWTLVTFGVALNYSMRLKIFFWALSRIPGNRSIGLDDRISGKGWLPLQVALMPDDSLRIIDNFRRMLPFILNLDASSPQLTTHGAPKVRLDMSIPATFPWAPKKYIVVHFFGMAPYRSLPVERWKSVLLSLTEANPTFSLVFTGDEKDRSKLEEIAKALPQAYLCIYQPILEVAGIIDEAALYIGVDTGITHLAGVLHQKSIILSHNGDLRWTLTYNPNARILVNSKRCTCAIDGDCYEVVEGIQYRRCLIDISDALIMSSVQKALANPDRSVPSFAGRFDEYER